MELAGPDETQLNHKLFCCAVYSYLHSLNREANDKFDQDGDLVHYNVGGVATLLPELRRYIDAIDVAAVPVVSVESMANERLLDQLLSSWYHSQHLSGNHSQHITPARSSFIHQLLDPQCKLPLAIGAFLASIADRLDSPKTAVAIHLLRTYSAQVQLGTTQAATAPLPDATPDLLSLRRAFDVQTSLNGLKLKHNLSKIEQLREEGNEYYQQSKYSLATLKYTQALELDPTNYILYSNRGAVFTVVNLIDQAIDDLTRAIQLNPNYESATSRIAYCYLVKGDALNSIKYYVRSIKIAYSNNATEKYMSHLVTALKSSEERARSSGLSDEEISNLVCDVDHIRDKFPLLNRTSNERQTSSSGTGAAGSNLTRSFMTNIGNLFDTLVADNNGPATTTTAAIPATTTAVIPVPTAVDTTTPVQPLAQGQDTGGQPPRQYAEGYDPNNFTLIPDGNGGVTSQARMRAQAVARAHAHMQTVARQNQARQLAQAQAQAQNQAQDQNQAQAQNQPSARSQSPPGTVTTTTYVTTNPLTPDEQPRSVRRTISTTFSSNRNAQQNQPFIPRTERTRTSSQVNSEDNSQPASQPQSQTQSPLQSEPSETTEYPDPPSEPPRDLNDPLDPPRAAPGTIDMPAMHMVTTFIGNSIAEHLPQLTPLIPLVRDHFSNVVNGDISMRRQFPETNQPSTSATSTNTTNTNTTNTNTTTNTTTANTSSTATNAEPTSSTPDVRDVEMDDLDLD